MPDKKPSFEVDLTRVIDAPCTQVYEAWVKPEQMGQWFAPKPYQLIIKKMDMRPGGKFSMAMRGPNNEDFPFTGTYREIVVPTKLSWTGEFASGPADQMSTEVTFEDQEGSKAKVHVHQTFRVMTPEIEQATKGAQEGWTMTLDQLAEFSEGISRDRIEKDIDLKAPISRVWQALTDHREFGAWFGVKLESPFVVDQVSLGHITHPGYEHLKWEAEVKKMEPKRLFSFTWHPYAINTAHDYSKETPTLVEFRLEKTRNGTRFNVTETGFHQVPAERRLEAFQMHDRGWAQQMKNIENYVGKKT